MFYALSESLIKSSQKKTTKLTVYEKKIEMVM
jgi:hypothetical protein